MLTIGVDAHKKVHVAVILNERGEETGSWRGPNNAAGWRDLLAWASDQPGGRHFGVEGAWGFGRGLAQYLVSEGQTVYEINARWTAQARRRARNTSKTDRLDARAVANFVRQEGSSLPRVSAEDDTAALNLLTVERDAAVAECTRLRNQLHALLMQLDPEYHLNLPPLRTRAGVAAVMSYVAGPGGLAEARASSVRRIAVRLDLALAQADEIAARIRVLAAHRFTPLTRLCGINLLTAGALAGMLGPGRRFRSDAALAAYAGISPLEASSADRVRHRLNRTGNRRLNSCFYRIALSQARHSPEAKAYLARRLREGKTKREAMRALKRHLVRAVFRLWIECV